MTTTIVFGKAGDGWLTSHNASYATARNGSSVAVDTSSGTIFAGQHHNSDYTVHEAFFGFDYSAISAAEMVAAALIRLSVNSVYSASVYRELRAIGYAWSGGGLIAADWQTAANLAGGRQDAQFIASNGADGKRVYAGSDNLATILPTVTSMEYVLATDRAINGFTPTVDEGIAVYSVDLAGTADDPALYYTTTTLSKLNRVLGACVQLSDATWAYLESDGALAPVITLKHVQQNGTVTAVATVPTATITSSTDFDPGGSRGAQAMALAVDSLDNLYVIGKSAAGLNVLAAKAYTKGGGYSWTAQTLRNTSLPFYDQTPNQFAAAWHSTNGGVVHVLVGHTPGSGRPTQDVWESDYMLLDGPYLLTGGGSGALLLGSGDPVGSYQPDVSTAADYNTFHNEVGTGMDLAWAGSGNATQGYAASFQKGQLVGANAELAIGRYNLNSGGTGLAFSSYKQTAGWGKKDANAKCRVIPFGTNQACLITADADAGWGLTAYFYQFSAGAAGAVVLGSVTLASESVTNMPDGPAVAGVNSWDAVYSAADNKIWVYYVDSTDATRLRRTSINLNTYRAVRDTVLVLDIVSGTAVIQAVRTPRTGSAGTKGLVQVASKDGATLSLTNVVDTFNIAPTAPTLTPVANYDATAAQTFAWAFNDPNVGDTQSAYQLLIERTDTGATVLDTGKVVSATSSRSVAGGTLTNGLSYRWKVRTYDAADVVGPYSGYGTFSTAAGGTVTVTVPAADNPAGVVTDDYQISWSVAGTTQASYRVVLTRNDTGATLSDTGYVTSTATTFLVTGMVSNVEHTISVTVRNAALVVSAAGTRKITPDYGTPELPVVALSTFPADGYTLVSINNPAPGGPAAAIPAYDFETGVVGWTPTSATFAQDATQFHAGTKSAKLVVTGTPVKASARPPLAAVTTGLRYTARGWFFATTSFAVTLTIDWYNAGSVLISSLSTTVTISASTWTLVTVNGTAPALATQATYGPDLLSSPPTGRTIFVDDLDMGYSSDRPEVTYNQILRRLPGETKWKLLGTADPDGTFRDYTANSGIQYEYRVRGQA